MAGPITWRSLFADQGYNQASNILSASQNSFNSAFNTLNKVLADRQNFQAQQAAEVQEGLKQTYLDRLQAARTPEELAALQQSGELAALQQRLTAANRGSVRGADEARLSGIRQSITQQQAYDDQQATISERGHIDSVNQLTAKKDFTGARAAAESLPIRFRGPLLTQIANAEQAATVQAHENSLRPITVETAKLNLTSAQNRAKVEEQTMKDNAEGRRLEERLAAERGEHDLNLQALGREHVKLMNTFGGDMKFPTNADGTPNFHAMNSDQLAVFDDAAREVGLPGSSVVLGGDTRRGANFLEKLTASGEFSPRTLQRYRDQITGVYNSAPRGTTGNDAYTAARTAAENEVGYARDDASNVFAPGSDDAIRARDNLHKIVPDIVKASKHGFTPEEDIPAVQALVGKWASEGITIPANTKMPDGTVLKESINIVPPAADIERFIRSVEPGGVRGDSWFAWNRDHDRAELIEKEMKDWIMSSEGLKRVQRGLRSQRYRDGQAVSQKLRDALKSSGK